MVQQESNWDCQDFGVCVTYRRVLDLMIGLIDHHSEVQVVQRHRWSTYFIEFSVTHKLGFSAFTSRILAKDYNTVIIPVSM
jgi:hypothetical protein